MVDIPVRQRRGVPVWAWALIAVLVVLIALALIDYFVTNYFLGPGAGSGQPARQDDPFGSLHDAALVVTASLLLPLHPKS